jgi:hypothetical protein
LRWGNVPKYFWTTCQWSDSDMTMALVATQAI